MSNNNRKIYKPLVSRLLIVTATLLGIQTAIAQSPHAGLYDAELESSSYWNGSAYSTSTSPGVILIEDDGRLKSTLNFTGTVTGTTITFDTDPHGFSTGTADNSLLEANSGTAPATGLATIYTLTATKKSDLTGPWGRITAGLPDEVYKPLVGAGDGADTLFLGISTDGIYRSTDNGLSWSQVIDSANILSSRALSRAPSGRIVSGNDTASYQNRIGNPIFYSENGTTWTESLSFSTAFVGANNNGAASFIDFTIHSDGNLYAADLLSHGAWKSTDNGTSWTAVGNGLPLFGSGQKTNGITSQGNALIAASDTGGFYRSTDNGANWVQSNFGITADQARNLVTFADGSAAFGRMHNAITKTTDGGATWTDIGGGVFGTETAMGTVDSIALHVDAIYVSTNIGKVAESTDGGNSWIEVETSNLPAVKLDGFEKRLYAHNGVLFAGTQFGLYRGELASLARTEIAPKILQTDNQTININEDSPFSFKPDVSSVTGPLTYAWTKDAQPLTAVTGDALDIANVSPTDAGSYTVTVSNTSGASTHNFTIITHAASLGSQNYDFSFIGMGGYLNSQSASYSTILTLPDGNLFIGGAFGLINSQSRIQTAVFTPAGDLLPTYNSAISYPNNKVLAAIRQRNGKFLIGYDGTAVTGATGAAIADDFLTRLDDDGRWDSSFQTTDDGNTIFDSNEDFHALAEGPNGMLYAAGANSKGILRFQPDGTLDTAIPIGGTVRSIIPLQDGSILVGGDIDDIRGQSAIDHFAKFTKDGDLFPGFNFTMGRNDEVLSMALLDNGKILLGGDNFVVRKNANGSSDTSFNPNNHTPNNHVNVVKVQLDGKILVGGSFTRYGNDSRFSRIVRLHQDGSVDDSFIPPTNLPEIVDLAIHPGGDVFAISSASAYRLFGTPVDFAITQHPGNLAVNRGDSATLSVIAYNTTSAPTFQWRKNGIDIAGANDATYTIDPTADIDAGNYDVTISDGVETLTSEAAVLTILGEPEFLQQPAHAFLLTGGSTSLSVELTGALPLTLQWQKDGVDVPGGTNATLLVEDNATTGAGTYTLNVTNSFDQITSIDAIVEIVDNPLAINTAFDLGTGLRYVRFNSEVTPTIDTVLAAPDGGFFITGNFSEFDGVPFVAERGGEGLTKFTSAGAIDTNFHFYDSGTFYALANHLDGDLLMINSQTTGIRKYNSTTGARVSAYESNQGTAGSLTKMAVLPGGYVVASGDSLNTFNSVPANRLVRLRPDGTPDLDFSPTGFGSLNIYGLLPLPQGKLLVYGAISTVTGTDQQYAIRLNWDGSFDDSFRISDNPLDNRVHSAIEMNDGSILIGGNFTTPRKYLARLNADGTLHDNQPAEPGLAVQTLNELKDGSVVVHGNFSTTSGVLFVMAPDGSTMVDGYAASNTATKYDVLPDGRILIGGPFTQWDGQTSSKYVAVLNGLPAQLSFDLQPIHSQIVDPGSAIELEVKTSGDNIAIQWQKGGINIPGATSSKLSIASSDKDDTGTYTAVITNSYGTVVSNESELIIRDAPIILSSPSDVAVLAKFQSATFSVKAEGLATLEYEWQLNGTPIPGANDATLVVEGASYADAGLYTVVVSNSIGSASASATLTVTAPPPGTIDATFQHGLNGLVNDVLLQGKKYVIGGSFTQVNNSEGIPTATSRLARLNQDGSLDSTFEATVQNFGGSGFPAVSGIRQFSNGDLLVFGSFQEVIDADETKTHVGAARITSDGKIVDSWNAGLNNSVTDAAIASDDSVVLIGTFSLPRSRIVRITPAGQWDAAFDPQPNVTPNAVAIDSEDRIIVGGSFTAIGGESQQYFARLLDDGSLDPEFVPPVIDAVGFGTAVIEVFVDDQDNLYLAGNVSSLNGSSTVTSPIRLESDGSWDSSFDSSEAGGTGSMKLQENGTLISGKSGGGAPFLFRYDANGNLDDTFDIGTGPDSNIKDLEVELAGSIIAAGQFDSWNGDSSIQYLARIASDVPPIAFAALPERIIVPIGDPILVEIEAVGTSTISYAWAQDGTQLGTTGPTFSIATASLADSGTYSITISNDSGTKTTVFEVIVYDAPVVLTHPQSTPIAEGNELILSTTAVGTGTLTYQWQRNGIDIAGATDATLTIAAISLAEAGAYSVIVSGTTAPPATSNGAIVSVYREPDAVDPTFVMNPSFSSQTIGTFTRAAPDGSVFVGTEASGSLLFRHKADGTRDDTFTTNVANRFTSFSAKPTDLDFLIDGRFIVNQAIYDDGSTTNDIIAPAVFFADGSLDTNFNVGVELTGVEDVLVLPDGDYLVAGTDMLYDGNPVGGIMKLSYDGTPDLSFRSGTGLVYSISPAGTFIKRLVLLSDGRVAICGRFDQYNGDPAENLCIIHADGQLDQTFVCDPIDQAVRDLAEMPDGRFAIVGQFQNVGAENRRYAAILNRNGSVDASFDPANQLVDGSHHPHRVEATIAGELLIVGHATLTGWGTSVNKARIHLLKDDGSPSNTWPETIPVYASGSHTQGIRDLDQHASGRLHIAGHFYSFNNITAYGFIHLNGYQQDPAFTRHPYPVVTTLGDDAIIEVSAFSEFGDVTFQWYKDDTILNGETGNSIFITATTAADAGSYHCVATNINNQTTVSRAAELRVVSIPEVDYQPTRISPVIGTRLSVKMRAVGGGNLTYEWLDEPGTVVSTDRDLEIYPVTADTAGNYRLRITSDLHGSTTSPPVFITPTASPGAVDIEFQPGTGPDSAVYAIELLPDDSALIGGTFTSYNSDATKGRLLRITASGSIDTTFDTGTGISTGTVWDVITINSDRFLVVGEGLTDYGASTVNNAFIVNATGMLDTTFQPAPGFSVRTAAVQANGKIILAGENGNLIRVDGSTGDLDTTLDTGTGFAYTQSGDPVIDNVLVLPDQRLAICGIFDKYRDTTSYGFVILTSNGTLDIGSGSAVPFNSRPESLLLLDDNHVLLGGASASFPLIKINVNDGSRKTFTQPSMGSQIRAMAKDANGKLIISGDNIELIRLFDDGMTDSSFSPILPNSGAEAIAVDSVGRIWVGGGFSGIQTNQVPYIVRYLGDGGSLAFLTEPQDATVDEGSGTQIEAIAIGPGPISYQWYTGNSGDDAAPIANETGETYTTPDLTSTAQFWVRVTDTGSGSSIDSRTATIAVITNPVITIDPLEVSVEFAATGTNLFTGVSAQDYLLQDISVNLTADVALDTNTLGAQTVTYSVSDSGGRTPNAPLPTRTYNIVDTTAPNLQSDVTDVSVAINYTVDPSAGITISDAADPGVTFSYSPTTIDTSTPGDVVVTYSATDASGNTSEITRTYHVVVDNTAPVISADPVIVNLAVGDTIIPTVLEGVTASDDIDGDITANITTLGDPPDPNTPGEYRIKYFATDFSGNRATVITRIYRVEVVANADTDGDGLDDDWERDHFSVGNDLDSEDLRYTANDDADGDGIPNGKEFRYGTNPRGYQVHLARGWNMISLFHLPPDTTITTIFSDGNGGTVYKGRAWKWDPSKRRYIETTNVEANGAVWLYAPAAASITIDLDPEL